MDEEYQKLDGDSGENQEPQEFEDEEEYYDIDADNHEHGHVCQCGNKVGLLAICALANIVTAVFTIIIATVLIINTVTAPKANVRAERKARPQRPQMEAIFEKGGMTFEQAMKEGKPMVVLFYADWCPHCRNFAPTFTKLSKDRGLSKKFNFVRINSESPEARAKMQEFKVEGFPALYLVNPKTKEHVFITNNLLFGESAKENLKEIFLDYANK